MSVGYKAQKITEFPWESEFPEARFRFFEEPKPLGTGGAVQAVFKNFSDIQGAWVFNGDTLLDFPLKPQLPASALVDDDVHYACLKQESVFDAVGNVSVDGSRVIKVGAGGAFFDAGQVFVKREAVEKYRGPFPVNLHELLHDSFVGQRVGFTVVPGTCYDIGTPQRLARFEQFLSPN